MLSLIELSQVGYHIGDDPDIEGMFYFSGNADSSEISYHTAEDAQRAAEAHLFLSYTVHRCASCNKVLTDESLRSISGLALRVRPVDASPSGECPTCGGLCYVLTPPRLISLPDHINIPLSLDQLRAAVDADGYLLASFDIPLAELVACGDISGLNAISENKIIGTQGAFFSDLAFNVVGHKEAAFGALGGDVRIAVFAHVEFN